MHSLARAEGGSRYEKAARPGAHAPGPGAPGLDQGVHRATNKRVEDRIRRRENAAPGRTRSASARRARRTKTHPRRDRGLEAGCGADVARAVSRRSDLRPERRQLSRTDAHSLYGLQSARPDAGARQGSVEDARALSPDSRTVVCRLPDAAKGAAAS